MNIRYVALFCLFFSISLIAEDQPDIKDSSTEDTITEIDDDFDNTDSPSTKAIDSPSLIDEFTTSPLKITGSFDVDMVTGFGWSDYPNMQDLSQSFDKFFGLKATNSLTLTAKPDPAFGVYGTLVTNLNILSMAWSPFAISTLYCDYVLEDTIAFQLGQFTSSWGQGRIFNPANLLSGSGSGFTVKMSIPTFLKGISFYSIAQPSYYTNGTVPSIYTLGYALKQDILLADVKIGLGMFLQTLDHISGIISLKTFLLGTDIFIDGVISYNTVLSYKGLAGFFWENKDLKLKIYGEYCYDSSINPFTDHTIGLLIKVDNIFTSNINFGIDYQHAFIDQSGKILSGISFSPFKQISVKTGFQFVYGNIDSRYVLSSTDAAIGFKRLVLIPNIAFSFSY